MRSGAATGHRGYFHETAFYGSDQEFLAVVVPFLKGGLEAGEPTIAALCEHNTERLRLWPVADRIVVAMTDRGEGPADPFAGLVPAPPLAH